MSHALKNNKMSGAAPAWQPSASIEMLRARAQIIKQIREFFTARDVLEVETPLLSHTSVTDPFIQSIPAQVEKEKFFYLQTSPEYAMKRLLAAGSGPIYQITKAFRQGEQGRLHNPEFTMLEWYRLNSDHHELMNEMDELLQRILKTPPAERKTYQELFNHFLNIDPHQASLDELIACAKQKNIFIESSINDRNTWLDLLVTHCIEPQIGKDRPFFLYDFPTSQAALAKIRNENPPVASRFEVYFQGMELANGFHELQDPAEQRQRFEVNLAERKQRGLPALSIDEYFLAALTHGLPDCAGVALGIDRLVLLATGSTHIQQILSFDFSKV